MALSPARAAAFALQAPLSGPLLGLVMRRSPPARRVLDLHTNPEELRRTARDALDEARRLGVHAPRLEALSLWF